MTIRFRRISILFVLLTVSLLASCLDETPQELTVATSDIPVPTNLDAVLGVDQISLSWDSDATFVYSGFAIYRSEDQGATRQKIGNSPTAPFVDATVRRNLVYDYRVSGIDENEIEGKQSIALTVRASFFAVVINRADAFTGLRTVQLTLTAPQGTQQQRVSEDPSFANAQWVGFSQSTPFELSDGDGLKTVYVEFVDAVGFASEAASDDITLDTKAQIASGSFTPLSAMPAGTLNFILTPVGGETQGAMQIRIAGLQQTIDAFDDGTGGDPTLGDGVYEAAFVLPPSFRGTDRLVSATFQDAAGNVSGNFELGDMLTITDPPTAITLSPPEDATTSSLTLRWSESNDINFDRYELYRDTDAGVSKDNSDMATQIVDAATRSFVDSDLDEGVMYYYVMYVVNDLEEFSASNVVMGQTTDDPPTAVVADSLSSIGADRLTLTWSRNDNSDFLEYRVYRKTSPGVTAADVLVSTISDRFVNFFDDTGLNTAANSYFYRVFVFDKGGNSARSNEVGTVP